MPKISLHSTIDPRDITKVLRDIHAENCFDIDAGLGECGLRNITFLGAELLV